MKHAMKPVLLSLISAFILTGCSHLPSPAFLQMRNKNYVYAKSIPPLRTPPGMSHIAFQNTYPIPEVSYPESAKNVSLMPPGLNG
jgi:uncharacterized lipoprotein